MTLKPTKLGKQKLAKKLARAIAKGKRVGKLTVRVRFALTPTTGARSAASKAYTLRLKRRR